MSFPVLQEVFQEFSTVAFIEFERGDTEVRVHSKSKEFLIKHNTCMLLHSMQGYVRFQEEGGAQRALEGLTKATGEGEKPQLCGADTELRVVAGQGRLAMSYGVSNTVTYGVGVYACMHVCR